MSNTPGTTWQDHVDWDSVNRRGFMTDDDFWNAVAEAEGLDYWEIADGDPIDWL